MARNCAKLLITSPGVIRHSHTDFCPLTRYCAKYR